MEVRRLMPEARKERAPPRVSIEEEALDRVVVERPEGVGGDQAVVQRVDVPVEELVVVHVPVQQVLPFVHHQHCDQELPRLYE